MKEFTERQKTALLSDLKNLQGQLPTIIAGVEADDSNTIADAVALVRGASGARMQAAIDRLTDYCLSEAKKGNHEPTRLVALGGIP